MGCVASGVYVEGAAGPIPGCGDDGASPSATPNLYAIPTRFPDKTGNLVPVFVGFVRVPTPQTLAKIEDVFGGAAPYTIEIHAGYTQDDCAALLQQSADAHDAAGERPATPLTRDEVSDWFRTGVSGQWLVMSGLGYLDPGDTHRDAAGNWAPGWGWQPDGSFLAGGQSVGWPIATVNPQRHGLAGAAQVVADNPISAVEALAFFSAAGIVPLLADAVARGALAGAYAVTGNDLAASREIDARNFAISSIESGDLGYNLARPLAAQFGINLPAATGYRSPGQAAVTGLARQAGANDRGGGTRGGGTRGGGTRGGSQPSRVGVSVPLLFALGFGAVLLSQE